MKKMKSLFRSLFYTLIILASLTACQGIKDGLTGNKKSNSDEFLVEKKNPLVIPPEFEKLPEPKSSSTKVLKSEDIDVEDIIKKDLGLDTVPSETQTTDGSLEKSIIEKIKNN